MPFQIPAYCDPKSGEHTKIVSDLMQVFDDYRLVLTPRFQGMIDYWKIYHSIRVDKRKLPDEDWRAFVKRATAFQVIETLTAVMVDLLTSPDPMIQVEGVGYEDDPSARAIERILQWDLRQNRFNIDLEIMQREKRIQGVSIGKVTYGKTGHFRVKSRYEADYKEFSNAVREAERKSGTKAPVADEEIGLAAFEEWREAVNGTLNGEVVVPPIPVRRDTYQTLFECPQIQRVPVWMTAFDPTIETIQAQRYFFHEIPVDLNDLIALADNDPKSAKPYILANIELVKGQFVEEQSTLWEAQLSAMVGTDVKNIFSAQRGIGSLIECWTDNPDMPLVQILNRKVIINKFPQVHPYDDGMKPFFYQKNTPLANQFIGLSEFSPSADLFEEEAILAELKRDAATLSAIPIFKRLQNAGFNAASAGSIRPGAFLDVKRMDALEMLQKSNPGIVDLLRELGTIRDDIDNTHATWSNVRGAGATVGRVSATDSVNRMNQALVRQKVHAQRDETDLQDLVILLLSRNFQFSDPEELKNIAGRNVVLTRDRFRQALSEDFAFRGATKAINKAEQTQFLNEFFKNFNPFMVMLEKRALMKEVLFIGGVKSVDKIVTPEGTKELAGQAALQVQGPPGPPQGDPLTALMAGAGGAPQGPLGVNPAPTKEGQNIPLDVLQMIAGSGQGAPSEGQAPQGPPA